ncbi:MAG: glycosyltransferase family 2 protein [Planctomycetes bacterium]|nr:glycosyltransferase family 2 protein [Planctomycetota bacterium]
MTVVVPAYNSAEFLPVTLRSLHQQTTPPERVVVVDDGSTDATAAVAEQHGATVLRQDRAGPGAARNRGLREATSEFVAFLDADDWYAPDKLERSVGRLRELGASCLSTDAWVVRGDRVERRKNDRRVVPDVLTLELLLKHNPIVCSSVVARRAAVVEAGAFDEDPDLIATEDYDLWLRMSAREPIAYVAEPMTFYRVHGASLSANQRFLRGVDKILDRVAQAHDGEAHFQALVRRRRAELRLDVAYDLITQGQRAEARQWITEADRLRRSWKGWRMRLRSLLPG